MLVISMPPRVLYKPMGQDRVGALLEHPAENWHDHI
jgi:hypothetical protein